MRSVDLFGHYATYCTRCFDFPLLVQEWIEGEEFAVMGLCSRDSELLSSLVVKKLGIGDDGECWMSTVVEKEELVEVLRSVVNAAQWVGPIECDFILSEQGLYLLECNPRFPSWVDGPASLGFNIPLQAVRIAHDLDCVDLPRPATGTVFYKDFQDLCLPASSCTSA
ncbi:MAG: ATP-grasp domain-containing protein [Verrucomicrobia bacterium]|nr:ATP-grasp domain-containing protein [Verrucomicrobiota bacterium]